MKHNFGIYIKNLPIIIILFLAIMLRFWGLGSTPPSLYWDEVSQGYNAYSILKTGYDEHHEFLPIVTFKAFGDYKAPVYIYLDILPQIIFGQTEFAVRLPSALFGSLSILLTYFLVKELFDENKRKRSIAIFSSFLLAISPWHIQLSRVAYEANIATFFTILALLLFLISINKKRWILIPSVISFVLAFYAFNAHRIFIPLIIVLLFIIYFKKLCYKKLRIITISFIVGCVLLLPFLLYLRTPESRLRFNEVNIFSDISQVELSNHLIAQDNNSLVGRLIHNRRVLYTLSYIKHYFDFQNPSYLFFKGDVNPRFSTQENGELYLFMLPFILIGIYSIIRSKGKEKYLMLGWFLLAPVAAATARETPHALRSETFIPLYEIFAGLGISIFFVWIRKFGRKFYGLSISLLVIVATFSVVNFLHSYFVHLPRAYSQDFQYGYKKAIFETEKVKDRYDQIIFSNTYGRAYIYVLWYGKYTPYKYWSNGIVKRDVFGFYNVSSFGKYIFKNPATEPIQEDKRTLFVGALGEIPSGLHVIDRIKFLDGRDAFLIADNP